MNTKVDRKEKNKEKGIERGKKGAGFRIRNRKDDRETVKRKANRLIRKLIG